MLLEHERDNKLHAGGGHVTVCAVNHKCKADHSSIIGVPDSPREHRQMLQILQLTLDQFEAARILQSRHQQLWSSRGPPAQHSLVGAAEHLFKADFVI